MACDLAEPGLNLDPAHTSGPASAAAADKIAVHKHEVRPEAVEVDTLVDVHIDYDCHAAAAAADTPHIAVLVLVHTAFPVATSRPSHDLGLAGHTPAEHLVTRQHTGLAHW